MTYFDHKTFYDFSKKGPKLIEQYFNDGIFDKELKDIDFESELEKLQSVNIKEKSQMVEPANASAGKSGDIDNNCEPYQYTLVPDNFQISYT